jgi:hypothetical protein
VKETGFRVPGTKAIHRGDPRIDRTIRPHQKREANQPRQQRRDERRRAKGEASVNVSEAAPLSAEIEELADEGIGCGRGPNSVIDDAQGAVAPVGNKVRRAAELDRRPPSSWRATHAKSMTIVGWHSVESEACACLRVSSALSTCGCGFLTLLSL